MRIHPIELMTYEKAMEILNLSPFFHEAPNKLSALKQEFQVRLDKVNEIVWKKYPQSVLEKIDESRDRLLLLSEESGNQDTYNDLRTVASFLGDIVLLFKNYEEMVAYTTLLYHLIEKENFPKQVQDMEDKVTEAEENVFKIKDECDKKLQRMQDHIIATTNKLRSAEYLTVQVEQMKKTIDLINAGVPYPEKAPEIDVSKYLPSDAGDALDEPPESTEQPTVPEVKAHIEPEEDTVINEDKPIEGTTENVEKTKHMSKKTKKIEQSSNDQMFSKSEENLTFDQIKSPTARKQAVRLLKRLRKGPASSEEVATLFHEKKMSGTSRRALAELRKVGYVIRKKEKDYRLIGYTKPLSQQIDVD